LWENLNYENYRNNNGSIKEKKYKEFTGGSVLDSYVHHYELALRATLCSLTFFGLNCLVTPSCIVYTPRASFCTISVFSTFLRHHFENLKLELGLSITDPSICERLVTNNHLTRLHVLPIQPRATTVTQLLS